MICIDNSEWSRNGDFTPTRFISMQDAANILCDAKTNQNPESTVGVMAMSGVRPEIHVTQMRDIGKLMHSISSVQIGGTCDILTSIRIAALSLKHRQNKSQKPRVVCFVCSPVLNEEKELVALGKKL